MKTRTRGTLDQAVGRAKQAVGRVTGNPRTEAEGIKQETAGRDERELGKLGDRVKGTLQEAGGRIKKTAGRIAGDRSTEASGKVSEVKGRVRRKLSE